MQKKHRLGIVIAGACAGAINGLFGAGGGMVLVPLLTGLTDIQDREIFPASVSIILPICLISLALSLNPAALDWFVVFLYLLGSCVGGVLAGLFGRRIPTLWLHRGLGIMILWGGIRYLC